MERNTDIFSNNKLSRANSFHVETNTTEVASCFQMPPQLAFNSSAIQQKKAVSTEEESISEGSENLSYIFASGVSGPPNDESNQDENKEDSKPHATQSDVPATQFQLNDLRSGIPTTITSSPFSLQENLISSSKQSPDVMQKMEGAFDQSFSDVNIIPDSDQAVQMNARAFAQGSEVHFAPGEYNPNTTQGQELLGHELSHVVQQRQGRVRPNAQMKGFQINNDESLEKEADEMGAKAAKGEKIAEINKYQVSNQSATPFQLKVIQKFDDEVVEGRVPEGRREELRQESHNQLVNDIRAWNLHLNGRQAFIHQKGVEVRDLYNQLFEASNQLKQNYRSAYASVDSAIQSANVSISLRQSAIDFVLSLLPGVGSSIIAIRATSFTGITALNAVANAAQDAALGAASSRAAAPVTDIQNQLTGTVQAPEQGGESAEQFTIRLMQSVNEVNSFRGEIFETSSRMGLGYYRDQVSFVLMELQRTADSPENRAPGVNEDAIHIQQNQREWPIIEQRLNSMVETVTEATRNFVGCQQLWSASDNHLLKVMLWVNYLGSISDDHAGIMDNDAIEDVLESLHLIGRSSYLGLDLGAYTSMSDEIMVVRRARALKPSVLRILASFSEEVTNSVLRQVAGETL